MNYLPTRRPPSVTPPPPSPLRQCDRSCPGCENSNRTRSRDHGLVHLLKRGRLRCRTLAWSGTFVYGACLRLCDHQIGDRMSPPLAILAPLTLARTRRGSPALLHCPAPSHTSDTGVVPRRRRRSSVPVPHLRLRRLPLPGRGITLAVRWYLRFGLSYRDVEELLAERGVEVDHVTVYRWVQRFTPLFADAARPSRHAVGDRWVWTRPTWAGSTRVRPSSTENLQKWARPTPRR